MGKITKPMLASKVKDMEKIQYPVFASEKLDGIRALKIDGKLVTRKFKLIPNTFTREKFEKLLPENTDGEFILKNGKKAGAEFNKTSSAVMSFDGEPKVLFHAFDYVSTDIKKPYTERMKEMKEVLKGIKDVVILLPKKINNKKELDEYEELCVEEGYEGIMIRTGDGPYKCGRSTEREGYLLKIKRFEDSEAEILGFEEKKHNENEAEKDAFGRTKRSTKKDGMVGAGTLGKIVVRDIHTRIEFSIGSGFNDAVRSEIWGNQRGYKGKIIKYKYQPSGAVKLPRFPVFLSFRHPNDMGGE